MVGIELLGKVSQYKIPKVKVYDTWWKLNDSLFRLAKLKTCVISEKLRANEEESRSLFLIYCAPIVGRSSSVETGKNLLDDHSTVAVRHFCTCVLQ